MTFDVSRDGIELLNIHNIDYGDKHRAIDPAKVAELVKSIQEIGLRSMPAARRIFDEDGAYVANELLYGQHRVEALKQLGVEWTDFHVYTVTDTEAQMITIAENLHRHELTKSERDQQIRRYAELRESRKLQSPQVAAIESKRADGRGHRQRGIASQIADEIGLSKDTVERALNPERAEQERQRQRDRRELPAHVVEDLSHEYEACADCILAHIPADEQATFLAWMEHLDFRKVAPLVRRRRIRAVA